MSLKLSLKSNSSRRNRLISVIMLVIALVLLLSGVYLLMLVASPTVIMPAKSFGVSSIPSPIGSEDRLYIPKIGVDVALKAGGAEVLNDAAWHRFPERGDPIKGGNFIVSAHRFEIGLTPGETSRKSPFFHIDQLNIGDEIIVNFSKRQFKYKITEEKRVRPTEVSIEDPTPEPRLTLYSCTLRGSHDGREVLFAKLSE